LNEEAVYRKVELRLVPFMMLLYLVAFLDRVNVGFAALTMNKDLGLTPTVFGWGAGIFFFGYFIFEVPSNVILERVGARKWIARIMVTWGIVSVAMVFTQGPISFYVLRFLLGVAEAGFLPGMIFYLTYWFPSARRARITGLFMAAVPLASAVGAPISGVIVSINEAMGLKGWQWLFILEGLPSVILGVFVLGLLPDGPGDAKWLSPAERKLIADGLAADRAPPRTQHALWAALKDSRVIVLSLVYLGIVMGLYGVSLWLPQIVKAMGYTDRQVGYLLAIPYAVSAAAMLAWGRHSDASGERVWHVALAAGLAAIGLVCSILFPAPLTALCALGVASIGIYATLGPFWPIPSRFLRGTAAAGGIALINAIGNLGGFLGPYLVGWVRERTGSFDNAMLVLAIAAALAALLVLTLKREERAAG
jgi:ACS family tartrate transporter-like MFS transporter